MKKQSFIGLLLITTLAACGNNEAEPAENEVVQEEAVENRILTDGMGNEVEIPANPKRVLASYLEDYLVALGVSPVAQWSVNDGASIQTYLQDDLGDLPLIPHDLPFEVVMEHEPDLMIIRDTVEQDMYDQYAQITPTYVLNSSPTEWRDTLLELGVVLGMEEKAETVIEEYDAKAEESASVIQEEAAGESAAAIWMIDTNLFVVHPERSSGAVMYKDLGLEVPEVVSELSGEADWAAISLEELAQMNVDHLFLVNSDGSEADLFNDRLWQNIPAVEQGNVYEFDPETAWLYYGPVASEQILNHISENILN